MSLPKTILVPTDFSEPASAALDYAVTFAEKTKAKVYLLHAYQLPVMGFPDGMIVASDLTGRILGAANKALDECMTKYAGRDVEMVPLVKQADPREAVIAVAKDVTADLIVMGTHGRRGIARALIGSVTESVVRTSPVPVLTVHGPTTT
jgi:nucleotide-binding universal stress UspA family protein